VVGPAIANAIHAAVGVRLRDLPMRPATLLAALAKKPVA
jgi:isoquinoline 1-oxidoreductase beta subunit